jgi:hypothetical protein
MAGQLGFRVATGVLSQQNKLLPGGWVVAFATQDMPADDYEVWHGHLRGPGGYGFVYIDNAAYGVFENGLFNEYAPPGDAMYVRSGQTVSLHWSTLAGTAPTVTLWLRQPEVGRL